jgi:hypothetical protein
MRFEPLSGLKTDARQFIIAARDMAG